MNALVGGTVASESRSPDSFGPRLNALRVKAGLTQSQLADRANVHAVTLSRLERGHIDPSWTMVKALAEALGVSPNDFLDPDTELETADEVDPPDRPAGKRK